MRGGELARNDRQKKPGVISAKDREQQPRQIPLKLRENKKQRHSFIGHRRQRRDSGELLRPPPVGCSAQGGTLTTHVSAKICERGRLSRLSSVYPDLKYELPGRHDGDGSQNTRIMMSKRSPTSFIEDIASLSSKKRAYEGRCCRPAGGKDLRDEDARRKYAITSTRKKLAVPWLDSFSKWWSTS